MEDIRIWFNAKRNYADGVQLYLKYGTDPQLIRLFTEEKESAFKKEKLISALDKILSGTGKSTPSNFKHQTADKKPNNKADKTPEPAKNTKTLENGWPADRDGVLQSLWLQWKAKFAEMMNLQSRIDDVAKAGQTDPNKQQEAGRMALRILTLDDQCDDLYYNRDYYLKNGKLPEEEKPVDISLDPNLWPRLLENHKRYVRRFKNALMKDPSNTEKALLLQKHEWAVSEYKKLLHIEDE